MTSKRHLFIFFCITVFSVNCLAQNSRQDVIKVVNEFFSAMEAKDSVAFNNLFLKNAYSYSVRQHRDSTLVRSGILKASTSKNTFKERLREEEITMHINKKIAAVWAPYDFWINGKHSHCGYEVFTLIKKDKRWKIASLTYSVEENACDSNK